MDGLDLSQHPRVQRAQAILSEAGWPDEWLDELVAPPDRFMILQEHQRSGERYTAAATTLREAGIESAEELADGWEPKACWDLDAPAGTAPYDRLVLSGTWTATMPWEGPHADH